MAKTKTNELRGLSADELRLKRESLEMGLGDLRQKKISGQLEKPHEFKLMRRQIAQIFTIEKEKHNAGTSNKK